MAALSLRPTLTEVLKVLTPCHGVTLHYVARCATQGHVSLFPHGWDAPSSHGREDYAKAVGLPFRVETKASCVSVWSRTRSLHLLRYVSPPYLTPSLTRCGTIAAQVERPSIPTPELPASASGIGMGRLTCYAWHTPCVTACHPSTKATLIAHSSPPRLCTYAVVMPSSPMLRGGSNHREGSNGTLLSLVF